MGNCWEFDSYSLIMQSEVIKFTTIGALSSVISPHQLPIRGVVGHNIDRWITSECLSPAPPPLCVKIRLLLIALTNYSLYMFLTKPCQFTLLSLCVGPLMERGTAVAIGITAWVVNLGGCSMECKH